jgi:hypothetical protein
MKKKLLVGVSSVMFAVFVLASTPALANPVVTSANRFVEIGNTAVSYGSSSSAVGIFNDGVSQPLYDTSSHYEQVSASQNSLVSGPTGEFSGTGSVSMGFSLLDTNEAYATSFFDVFFTLPSASAYTLTGLLFANADGGIITSRFFLDGPTPLFYEKVGWGHVDMNDSGTLAAGSYELKVYAAIDHPSPPSPGSYMGGQGSYAFDFQIDTATTSVPEPGTFTMMLAGISGLLGFAVRRRKQREAD